MKNSGEGARSTSACGRDPASFLDHFKHCVLHSPVSRSRASEVTTVWRDSKSIIMPAGWGTVIRGLTRGMATIPEVTRSY